MTLRQFDWMDLPETSNVDVIRVLTKKIDNVENTILLLFGLSIVSGATYFICTSIFRSNEQN